MSEKINLPVEMCENYLERRLEELSALKKNQTQPDFLLLKKWGHQIKGNAKSFGFDELTSIAIRFEKIAENKNLEDLLSAITAFELCLDLCAQRLALEKTITNK